MDNFTLFDALVWGGAALTLFGLGLLVLCIVKIFQARKRYDTDEGLQAALGKLVPLNLGAVALSALGLMLVVVGLFLG